MDAAAAGLSCKRMDSRACCLHSQGSEPGAHGCRIGWGSISVKNTGGNYQMLLGNLVSILLSAIITVTGSLIWPANYDFVSMRQIALDDDGLDDDLGALALMHQLQRAVLIMLGLSSGCMPATRASWRCTALNMVSRRSGMHRVWFGGLAQAARTSPP